MFITHTIGDTYEINNMKNGMVNALNTDFPASLDNTYIPNETNVNPNVKRGSVY